MDNKGFISIEYLFSLFILIIIALGVLFQVNSNGVGYSKYVRLPSDKGYFEITVERNSVTMEYDEKKGETLMMFTNLNSKYKLVSGRGYMITKTSEGVVIS